MSAQQVRCTLCDHVIPVTVEDIDVAISDAVDHVFAAHVGDRRLRDPKSLVVEDTLGHSEAADLLTGWYDDTTWLPFVESEECDITGPGHQDGAAFAALITAYDRHSGGSDDTTEWTATDISHRWAVITDAGDGGVRLRLTTSEDPHAIPITTLWGAR